MLNTEIPVWTIAPPLDAFTTVSFALVRAISHELAVVTRAKTETDADACFSLATHIALFHLVRLARA